MKSKRYALRGGPAPGRRRLRIPPYSPPPPWDGPTGMLRHCEPGAAPAIEGALGIPDRNVCAGPASTTQLRKNSC